jgi:single-strand DNA-binding protein
MANLNLNKVILGGRLTADVELKTTPSGVSVCSFSLAINRKYVKQGEQPQTDFINIVAWRTTAEFISKYFKKGSCICISGSIQTRNYTDNNGNKRTAFEVVADEAYFVDSKNETSAANADVGYTPPANTEPHFEELEDGDDLPF